MSIFWSSSQRKRTISGTFSLSRRLETLPARPVDLVDRKAIQTSRNYIRKRHILTGAEPVYAA
jgi:predicted nucleotidyltransferase